MLLNLTKTSLSYTERIRERIVGQAQNRFFTRGVSAVTMDHLAVDLGISKKTLYKHFASKAMLLLHVLETRMNLIETDLQNLVSRSSVTFTEKLNELVRYAIYRFSELKDPFVDDLRRNTPEILIKIEEFRERIIPKFVSAIVAEGIRLGHFRSDIDPNIVAQIMVHAAQGILIDRRFARLNLTEQEAIDTIVRVVIQGIEIRG